MQMGEVFRWGKTVYNDPRTGREVWQMTSGEWTSHAPYMYHQAFSHDERYCVFSSDRSGSFQLYRMEVASGEACRLTDFATYSSLSLVVGPDGREVYFGAGPRIWAADIETSEQRLVTDCTTLSGGQHVGPRLSRDGKKVLCTYRRPDGRIALAQAEIAGSPPTEVHVFEGAGAVSHVNVCPTDSDIISYVPLPDRQNERHLPPEQRARAWKLNLRTGKAEPFLVMPPGFRATHDYWAPDGSKLYFHKKHVPNWVPTSICSIPKDGGEMTTYYTSETSRLGHSGVHPDQSMIVSDNQAPKENELLLIHAATGEAEVLCWPNASGSGHPNHVHPAFSRSGRMIIYTSDLTGYAQVYIVPLQQ